MDFTVPMALVDFIPVIMFFVSFLFMQFDLYYKFDRWSFGLFWAGGIMVFMAGFYKALWKLLYAAGVCDFEKLNQMFFPVQAHGFLILGLALIFLLTMKKKDLNNPGKTTFLSVAAPAVFSGTMLFVVFMVFGVVAMCVCMAIIAVRMNKKFAVVLFIISIIFMLGMGYLSSKDFTQAYMNWAGEFTNILGQVTMMGGVLILHKGGLRNFDIKKK